MLETIGFTTQMARWAVATDTEIGRVLQTDGAVAHVLTEAGVVRAGAGGDLLSLVATDPSAAPVPGDWVVVRHWPDHRDTVTRVLPRRGALAWAPEVSVAPTPLCTHVDVVAIAVRGSAGLDVAAAASGARPVVPGVAPVLALVGADPVGTDLTRASPDLEVVHAGSWPEVAPRLREMVAGRRTIAVLGPRTRDRTALLAALVGTPVLRRPREAPASGASPILVPLPGGGAAIDPGPAAWRHQRPRLAPVRRP